MLGLLCSMKNYTSRRNDRPRSVAHNKIKIALLIIAAAVILCLFLPRHANSTTPVEVPAPEEPAERIEPVKVKYTQAQIDQYREAKEATVSTKLVASFSPEEARIALAILKQESGLNLRATNYNCWYDTTGIAHETRVAGTKSKPCKTEDRPLTWSVDCGISQINFSGKKECPEYSYGLDWSIEKMVAMHAERGFAPWVAYTAGLYIPFLK